MAVEVVVPPHLDSILIFVLQPVINLIILNSEACLQVGSFFPILQLQRFDMQMDNQLTIFVHLVLKMELIHQSIIYQSLYMLSMMILQNNFVITNIFVHHIVV